MVTVIDENWNLDGDDAVAQVENVVDVSVDQLDGQEVLVFTGIVHDQA